MKSSLLSLVSADRVILDRIEQLASWLPSTGPEPVAISLAQGGCITYLHDPEATPIIGLAFGLSGWRSQIVRGGSFIDVVKRLPNGVSVCIMHVTEVKFDEEIPMEFFTTAGRSGMPEATLPPMWEEGQCPQSVLDGVTPAPR